MFKLLSHCVILFGFRKGKTDFSHHLKAIYGFLVNLLNIREQKTLFTFIVDHGLRWFGLVWLVLWIGFPLCRMTIVTFM